METQHDEYTLSKRELAWKEDALQVALGLVENYVDENPTYPYDVALLDEVFEKVMALSWWKRPRKFAIITGLGYALGQYLVDKMGFEWMVYKDFQGKDIAVKHAGSGIISFPISSVRKRIKTKEYRFMVSYIEALKQEL